MGAYLSEPLTDKASSDESNEYLVCGLSSMQGWRMTQEDAHNAVLNFEDGASLFAVYDGHGGHEVAAYCAEHLPKFIKELEAYKKGDVLEALKEAFLGFDSTLTKPEIISILKELAGNKEDGQSTDEDDEENVSNLAEEASMPIEQLLAKYSSDGALAAKKLKDGTLPASPYLKARRSSSSSAAGCSSSSDGPSSSGSGAGCSSSSSADQVSSSSTNEASGSSSSNEVNSSDDVPDTQSASPDVGSSGDVKDKEDKDVGSSGDVKVKTEKAPEEKVKDEKDTETAVSSGSSGSSNAQQNGAVDSTDKKEVNGDLNHKQEESDSTNDTVSSSSPSKSEAVENGEVSASPDVRVKGKGKAKDKSPRPDPEAEQEKDGDKKKSPRPTRLSSLQMFRNLIKAHNLECEDDDDSDDTEDEDDTTFEGGNVESSDEDEDEDVDGEEDEDEEDEDEEEDEEDSMDEDEDDECEDFGMGMKEEPGADSGCTAVVALLKGRDLYVANAGDSRCVVCRNGTAIEMSLDHKPEDPLEWQRILNAGGKVTCDGRVNGGLNLSRAIGDHAYKQNKEMTATEQMITALPDVKTLRINPDVDEFMVLACDGIWNYLSSQDVVDFVRKRLQEGKLKVSQICEELFDHCLAPNTLGDGTGCDNMTAVIVKFKPELSKLPVTLTTDSVFDEPIKNEKTETGVDAEAKHKVKVEAEAKAKVKVEADAEAKAKVKVEVDAETIKKELPGDEVSTSKTLKRSAPSSEPEGSNGSVHADKKIKVESEDAESSTVDSEAVAVEV